jgi:hypothetical protein
MRVLVACEYSGRVRDAFIAGGHDALSCDLLPTEVPGPHYQGDVRDILHDGWDLMVAHPPCTYLCSSGIHWNTRRPERWQDTEEAASFFLELMNAPISRIAVENPIGIMSTRYRKPDQIVQPWQFGHGETKATCFWLKNLPPLFPTEMASGRVQRIAGLPPSDDRWKIRSETYPGIAAAMARQWGNLERVAA